MARAQIERRLIDLSDRLNRLRDDLRIADEQLEQFASEADDARIRALVSETPIADKEHREADRHAKAMQKHRSVVLADIERLELVQDDLLDQLLAGS
jgi:hypothetical protein